MQEINSSEASESVTVLAPKSTLMLRFKRVPNEIYSSESEEEINVEEIPAQLLEQSEPVKTSEDQQSTSFKARQTSPPPPQKLKNKDQSFYRKKAVPEVQQRVV